MLAVSATLEGSAQETAVAFLTLQLPALSDVTMAVHKFLQRIVAPDLDVEEIERASAQEFASHLYHYTQ